MWTAQPGVGGDRDDRRGARVAVLVHRMAESGDVVPAVALPLDRAERERVPPGIVVRQHTVMAGKRGSQELAAVLGHAQEARATTEDACGKRALHRLRGA